MGLVEIFQNKIWTIVFYSAIIILLYLNRKKFKFQGIMAIYRTKIGISLMDKWGKKYSRAIKILGFVGIVSGFLFMIVTLLLLLFGVFQFLTVKDAPPSVAPLLPGIDIPGSPINLPLVSGFIAIFIVIVVHEFAHGLVARAYKIPVLSTGYVQMAIFPAAFVEPDEKKLSKSPTRVQLSLFAAGAFANVLFAIFALLLMIGFGYMAGSFVSANYETTGFSFEKIEPASPAERANLLPDKVYTQVNGIPVNNATFAIGIFSKLKPGDTVKIGNDQITYEIETVSNKLNSSKAFIGISGIKNNFVLKSYGLPIIFGAILLAILMFISELLTWTLILNIAIGSVNMLPLGPIDGGRMFLLASQKIFGKNAGKKVWAGVSYSVLFIFIILLFQFALIVGKAVLSSFAA